MEIAVFSECMYIYNCSYIIYSSGYLRAKQYMEEENYDKIISESTKEIEAKGKYMAEALLLRATFYLLIGNASAAKPDLDQVISMEDANVKVRICHSWIVVGIEKLDDKLAIYLKKLFVQIFRCINGNILVYLLFCYWQIVFFKGLLIFETAVVSSAN